MARIIFLIFLLVPLVEIAGFVVIGQLFGLLPTLAGVLVSAVIGAVVLRQQGLSLLSEFRGTMGRRQLPGRTLADAMMVGAAGLLLLVPGYFSDLLGILLLIPLVRGLLYGLLKSRVLVIATAGGTRGWSQAPPDGGTVDLDEDDWRRR